VDTVDPDGPGSVTGIRLDLSPSFSYFVADGFAVSIRGSVGGRFGDLYSGWDTTVGVALGVAYVFRLRVVLPYLGMSFGPSFIVPAGGDSISLLALSFGAGLLIPLSYHVAIDVGMQPTLAFGVNNFDGVRLTMPMGALGVRALF